MTGWVKQLVAWIVLTCLMVGTASAVAEQEQVSVNRLNFGVYFQYKFRFYPVVDHWEHIFKVPLPSCKTVMVNALEEDLRERKGILDADCTENVTRWGNINLTQYEGMSKVGRQMHCENIAKYINKIVTMVHEGTQYLARLCKAIKGVPTKREFLKLKNRRGQLRRAVIEKGGDFLHWLFGVATEKQLKKQIEYVKAIRDYESKQLKLYNATVSHIQSFATASNERIEQIEAKVVDNIRNYHEDIEQMAQTTRTLVEFYISLTHYTIEMLHMINYWAIEFEAFLDSMELVLQGRLPPLLIADDLLHDTLQNISSLLVAEHSSYA